MDMTQTSTDQTVRLTKYGINGIARQLSLAVITAALLFLGAQTLNWSWGWVFSIVNFTGWLGLSLALARWNPELLNVRGKRARQMQGTKFWDWVLLSLYSLILLVQPLFAGLDYRSGWSTESSPVIYIAGNVLTVVSFVVLTWSMVENRFFEMTVRIQTERTQQVTTTGPYRYMRHPGYVGVILSFVALPVALGTWAALIPGVVGVIVFVIRTALEDRTLQTELPGYADYAQQTRYRLLPGIW
jgi:protein-S-isoprenylcysteine O-methyltransferase Ste14